MAREECTSSSQQHMRPGNSTKNGTAPRWVVCVCVGWRGGGSDVRRLSLPPDTEPQKEKAAAAMMDRERLGVAPAQRRQSERQQGLDAPALCEDPSVPAKLELKRQLEQRSRVSVALPGQSAYSDVCQSQMSNFPNPPLKGRLDGGGPLFAESL